MMKKTESISARNTLSLNGLSLAALLLGLLVSVVTPQTATAGIDKVTSSTALPLKTPSAPIADAALLDVGITPLNDGLDLTDEDDTVFPEVRFAEAIYFSNQLAKVMEKKRRLGCDKGDTQR